MGLERRIYESKSKLKKENNMFNSIDQWFIAILFNGVRIFFYQDFLFEVLEILFIIFKHTIYNQEY